MVSGVAVPLAAACSIAHLNVPGFELSKGEITVNTVALTALHRNNHKKEMYNFSTLPKVLNIEGSFL